MNIFSVDTPASNTGVISPNTAIAGGSPWGVVDPASTDQPTDSDLKQGRRLRAALHWLTATTKEFTVMDAVSVITDYLGHGPEVHQRGQFGYTCTFEWYGGLKLLDNEKRPDMGICLLADGDTCEHYGFDMLACIYESLHMNATRLDLAVDGCRFTPAALRNLWLQDCVRTQARPMKDALAGRSHIRTNRWFTSPNGDTFYMGSRSSTQFARCYNSRGYTRFEMELKKERASQTMAALLSGAEFGPTIGAAINQFVGFVFLDDDKRERCTVLPFWRKFMNRLTTNDLVTRLGKSEATNRVQRLFDWIEQTVAPSLAVYEILKGERESYDDVRRNLRKIGLERAKPRHMALVKEGGGWLHAHRLQYNQTLAMSGFSQV